MKRLLIATAVCVFATASLWALNRSSQRAEQQLHNERTNWIDQTQNLARVQGELGKLSGEVQELRDELKASTATTRLDPELFSLLLTNDLNSLSVEAQNKLSTELRAGLNFTSDYVLVSKAALANSDIRPFKKYPDASRLTPIVRLVLAITPAEGQAVEAEFAQALQRVGRWAQANAQRENGAGDRLVSYTIPAGPDFENTQTNELFGNISKVIGSQRTELLQQYFNIYRIYEDGAIGLNTNKLSIWRVPGKPGLFYEGGWDMGSWSAKNDIPEPINLDRFPTAFRYVFPGGWQEIADREGFTLEQK